MFKRFSILSAAFVFSASAQAVFIDFTDSVWKSEIDGNQTATLNITSIGNITLTALGSTNNRLTFNSNDNAGCIAGKIAGLHSLACDGDGTGVNNDEVTQQYVKKRDGTGSLVDQSISISFDDGPVYVNNIFLLDLFGQETGYSAVTDADGNIVTGDNVTGEIAVINGIQYHAVGDITGGFYATGGLDGLISEIIFSGNNDFFSDYAFAAIDIELSPVPVPGAAILFGSALLGFFGFKRRRTV